MQRSSNVSVCGSFSNEKDKIKQKTHQYEWNDTHTEKDDKDMCWSRLMRQTANHRALR